MNPSSLFKKIRAEEPAQEYYFALEIIGRWLKGAIWTVESGRIKVLVYAPIIHWESEQELTERVNESYSQAVSKAGLLPNQEPKKIIFGLPFEWVEGEKITGLKLELLRVVCQRMKIKPVGFVVTTEAIIKYLKAVQGTAPSAIIVWLDKDQLEVVLLRSGQVIGRPMVQRSGNLGDDLAEGLARIELQADQILPARILLYGFGDDFEELSQQVMDFPWLEESFQFLHLPKVEIMPPEFDIQAVALAGGTEVVSAGGVKVEMGLPEAAETTKASETKEVLIDENNETEGEIGKEKEVIGKEEEDAQRKGTFLAETEDQSKKAAFGFTKQDLTQNEEGQDSERERPASPEPSIRPAPSVLPMSAAPGLTAPSPRWWKRLPKTGGLLRKFFRFRIKNKAVLLIGGGLGVFLLFGGCFAAWWYLPTAQLTLFVKPFLVEKTYELVLDPNVAQADKEKMIFPALPVTVTLRDQLDRTTTGTKVVGEKARGQVAIFNRTPTEKELAVGTILTGPGGLNFSLNESVVIASESAGEDYTRVPGKAMGTVTAAQIGSESNLAGGTEFEVGKYSKTDVVAKSESDFTGGTSEEIRIVSPEDLEAVKDELVNNLESRAKAELESLLEQDQMMIAESIGSKVVSELFHPELGAEAEMVTATVEVEFEGLTYHQAEFDNFIQEKIASSIPPGYEYQDEQKQVEFNLEKMEGKQAIFQVKVWANLMPLVPVEQIKENLRGKNFVTAIFYLDNLANGVTRYSPPNIKPQFIPEAIRRFPRQTDHITIDIRPE